ncbi:hypothetical protein RKE29_13905 [Streptomyces sp. B1866]|uniref:hypothetical protein n=1 Tax=Streptomyces sp. B1866 TaxID=3075431 RepID=UPI00288D4D21|nr:hypothetical protein [Streptomyces sp. B1866]MDT3397727.1 hypothetical protein [Streptomyces sp. B1866]
MQIHRSRHVRGYTVLPNALLQDRRLSYTARGLLADLLSRPDGWREDGRQMADSSPQGRTAIAKALRELTRAGYYRVEKVRQADGTFVSVAHVFDTPQPTAPGRVLPVSGRPAAAPPGTHPVKNPGKEPSLPVRQPVAEPHGGQGTGPTAGEGGKDASSRTPAPVGAGRADEPGVPEAVAALYRVIRPEPRLRLGAAEAQALAPLVTAWLEQGRSEHDIAAAVLPGLPARVHAPAALLRDRLTRKLPPATPKAPVGAVSPRWRECPDCGDPMPQTGACRPCEGLTPRPVRAGTGQAATARGIARVRAALRPATPRPVPAHA